MTPALLKGGVAAQLLQQENIVLAEGRWRLYYAGLGQVGGPGQGIGLAMTDKEDMLEFEGVRVAFRRRV